MRRDLSGFELMVVLALMRLGDDAYGVPIAQELEQRAGREVALGSVYAALERLEAKGFVSSTLGEPTAMRGGPVVVCPARTAVPRSGMRLCAPTGARATPARCSTRARSRGRA